MNKKSFFIVMLFVFAQGAAAATLKVNSEGILIGASNVDVGGASYEVGFLDGGCIGIAEFGFCNELSDFAFNDIVSADLATQALLDQVLIDGTLGNFDSNPALAFGCANDERCKIFTPYNFVLSLPNYVHTSIASNGILMDELLNGRITRFYNTELDPNNVFAAWTPTPVPVPAAIWLFGTALIGLIGTTKRRKLGKGN
jgi:hypothetical protein